MATFGVDFRATSGYVTDPTDYTYCLGDSYPTTRGGFTFGWIADALAFLSTRDRDNTVTDKRLAGINFAVNALANGVETRFQLDKTGAGTIIAAFGDLNNAQTIVCSIRDSGGTKFSLNTATSNPGEFYDGSQTLRTSAADWTSNNQPSAQYTFAGYVMYHLDDTVGVNTGEIATLAFVEASGGTTVAITGNSGTFSPGTVLPATSSALTGNVGTFGPGTVIANTSKAITGNSSAFTPGTVVPNTTAALTGNQATFTPGTVSTGNDVAVAITGNLAAFAPGTLLPATTSVLIGQTATLSAGTVQAATDKAISGQAGTFTPGSVAASNIVALSGNPALFTPGQVNYVGDVTVAITGNAILCTTGIVGVDSGQVINSAGWGNATYRPDRETIEQKKRLRWRAYEVIKKIEQIPQDNTESLDVLQKEARKVSRELAMTIDQLESALRQPIQTYGQASQQWDRKQQRQQALNTQVMLETQLESFQQQQEELDIAFVMMMILHAIEDFY